MQEIVALALDDGAHGVEQRLLALLEHLNKHARALIGVLNLFLLLILLHAQGSRALVAVIHQEYASPLSSCSIQSEHAQAQVYV